MREDLGVDEVITPIAIEIRIEPIEPLVDPRAFRLERFSDGTKITIDAGF